MTKQAFLPFTLVLQKWNCNWACSDELQRALHLFEIWGITLGMRRQAAEGSALRGRPTRISHLPSALCCASRAWSRHWPAPQGSVRKMCGFYGSGKDQAKSYSGLKGPHLTHVLKINDGHCSTSNAAHQCIFFHFSLLSGACGE
ncbi:hypothetical protein BKA93DRAFT_750256 [Sparassis latifolia]